MDKAQRTINNNSAYGNTRNEKTNGRIRLRRLERTYRTYKLRKTASRLININIKNYSKIKKSQINIKKENKI